MCEILILSYSGKFSRQAHNFRGLAFSKNFATTIFVGHGSVPLARASIRYFNASRSLIFEVRCQAAKIMCLEHSAPFGALCLHSVDLRKLQVGVKYCIVRTYVQYAILQTYGSTALIYRMRKKKTPVAV